MPYRCVRCRFLTKWETLQWSLLKKLDKNMTKTAKRRENERTSSSQVLIFTHRRESSADAKVVIISENQKESHCWLSLHSSLKDSMQTSTILPMVTPCSADWSLNQSLVSGATEMESCTLLFFFIGLPAPGLLPPLILSAYWLQGYRCLHRHLDSALIWIFLDVIRELRNNRRAELVKRDTILFGCFIKQII